MFFVVELAFVIFLSTLDSFQTTKTREKPRAPPPKFHLSVNGTSKSILVTVETEREVKIRWCYQHGICVEGHSITLNPAKATSALLSLPHVLPCICVQVYYTSTDAKRNSMCPFVDSLNAARDVLPSSDVALYNSSLRWKSLCPTKNLQISASLCWKHQAQLCTRVSNTTLKGTKAGSVITYDTSSVDKHPQMCLQLSLHQSQRSFCNFTADMSTWEAFIEPSQRSVFVHLRSPASAAFSAQLCVLRNERCAARGAIVSVRLEGKDGANTLAVPLHDIADRPCVQVWRSDPALQGRRILCPDYSPSKSSLIAVAALFAFTILVLLVICCRSSARCTADWLHIQEPVLLVCSSDQPPQISAVSALASVLQGELGATVHMTLWSKSSGSPSGSGAGVADLGPLPWLYGQWDAVQEADGSILIIWSPEAKQVYRKWKEMGRASDEEMKTCGGEDEDYDTAVIRPVFTAALSCLKGALQESKSQRVSIVYFEGLGHRKDIPKPFRSFPCYCIPQHFSGLLQELAGKRSNVSSRWRCWTRLLLKMLSLKLSRQLQRRLTMLSPETNDGGTVAKTKAIGCSPLISYLRRTRVET
ncbi:interleukin-17 receptor E [Neosynchiropus ocellatus]